VNVDRANFDAKIGSVMQRREQPSPEHPDGGFTERSWHWWLSRVFVPVLVAAVAAAVAIYVANTKSDSAAQPEKSPPSSNADSGDCADGQGELANGWGPDRPTVGPSDYAAQPSFNVDRQNPNYGDERGFLIVKEQSYEQPGAWSQALEVLPNQTYMARIYIHNGASDRDEYAATDANIRLALPACSGRSLAIRSYISASNAYPETVWSSSVVRSESPIRLELVPGSVEVSNNQIPNGVQLPDRLFAPGGVKLGSRDVGSGVFRGDYANSAIITALFRVVPV
jgi:hypothetical protein